MSVAAGAAFGLAWLLFVDGVITLQKEANSADRFSFPVCIPVIISVIGLLLFLLISPQDIREERRRAEVVLFVAWLSMFASSIGALTIVFLLFKGVRTRARASPGVELVLCTAIMPIAGALVWWSRSVDSDTEDW